MHVLKKTKEKHVYKKDVKEKHPYSKAALAEFVQRYPEVLEYYKKVKGAEGALENKDFEKGFDERAFAKILMGEFQKIKPGRDEADRYHNYILSVLNFLFYPNLITPKKEAPLNQGRKKIDIRFTNTGVGPFFSRILNSPQTRALSVVFECKNYSADVANPEVDQIAMRFSAVRGYFGAIVCRSVDNERLLLERCRDVARDGHGYVVTLSDVEIMTMLNFVKDGARSSISRFLNTKLDELLA